MSGSSRSRQKHKLEPISLEELAGTTGMSGFCTFLTRDNSVAVPALDGMEIGAPDLTAPDSAAPAIPAPDPSAPTVSAPETSAPDVTALESHKPESSAPESDAVESDAPESSAPNYVFQRRVRIREVSTVQDAHSLAEQAVYDAMYRAGQPYQGDSRILTIGLRSLADLSRMAYSNCKANVRSLIAKLAIEERGGFSYTDGRTYIIYSFREILRRRKVAGFTHVIRNRGVAFVDPVSGIPLQPKHLSQSSAPDSSAPGPLTSALESPQASAPIRAESSAPETEAHIRNRNLNRNPVEEASSFLGPIVSALRRYIPDVDDDAARELWRRCRENAPDAEITEVVHFVDLKAGKPGIRMPLGFLLAAVPKCFVGDAYRQFREEGRTARQTTSNRDRMFAEEILRSPEADEEQKQWAREVLSAS
jgi:hypothetical protein